MFESRAARWTLSFAGFMLVAMTSEAQSDPFATTSRSGAFIYVSGTRATDAAGKLIAGDIKAQTKRTLENLEARIKGAGSSLAMAASINVYLKNAADFAAMAAVISIRNWSNTRLSRTSNGPLSSRRSPSLIRN
jgi:enamine deaminase RidA (YjgF/YER057c/UK114 family)